MRQAYDYWQNQPDNTFVRHSRGARAAGADGSRGAHPPRGVEGRYQEGAHEAPGRRGAPGVPGVTRAAIQLPPLSPSAPVRTQWSRRAARAGGGGLRHTALGWRVRTPWTTPANGGSHGAAPPRNLVSGVASGHPSTDSSGAGGQRAPGLQAPPRRPRRGRSPDAARRGSRGSPTGAGAGHKAHQHTRPRKGIHQAGKVTTADGLTKSRASSGRCGGETLRLTSTHTLRPSLGGCHPCNRSVPKTQLEYGSLTRGLVWRWSVHDILPIVSGPVFMRKTRRGRDLGILARRSGPSTGES